jgi:hypothetical protein
MSASKISDRRKTRPNAKWEAHNGIFIRINSDLTSQICASWVPFRLLFLNLDTWRKCEKSVFPPCQIQCYAVKSAEWKIPLEQFVTICEHFNIPKDLFEWKFTSQTLDSKIEHKWLSRRTCLRYGMTNLSTSSFVCYSPAQKLSRLDDFILAVSLALPFSLLLFR